MPKKVFWPVTLIVMGCVFLASNLGFLPKEFWNFWPIVLIIVGLGGVLTSDREEWMKTSKKTTRRTKKRKSSKRKK